MTFSIEIPWQMVSEAYERKLQAVAKEMTLKGFRRGKAPKKMVEKQVGKRRIVAGVIDELLPQAYQQEVKRRNLVPMIPPRVSPVALEEGKPWRFEVVVIERPEVKLGDYQEKVREALAPSTIVTPGETEADRTAKRNRRLTLALDALLEAVEVELPWLLVEEEVNTRLAQLVDQVSAIGMTVEQYLRAKGLSPEKLRAEYQKTSRESLKLNLALAAVARERKFEGKQRIQQAVDWLLSL